MGWCIPEVQGSGNLGRLGLPSMVLGPGGQGSNGFGLRDLGFGL